LISTQNVVLELNVVRSEIGPPQQVTMDNTTFLSHGDSFAQQPLKNCLIGLAEVENHIQSLLGLCELEQSFCD
jgi:hypothetical protein